MIEKAKNYLSGRLYLIAISLVGLLLLITVPFVVITAWERWHPYNPVTVLSFTIDKKVVCRGDTVIFTFNGQTHMDIIPHATIELRNKQRSYSLLDYFPHDPIGFVNTMRPAIIPYNVIPDEYEASWIALYRVNANQDVSKSISAGTIVIDDCFRGIKGDRGEKGDRGFKGDHGDKGDNFWGRFQGAKGDRGYKGDKGNRGEKGAKGAPGRE